MSTSITTNLDDTVAVKAREIAAIEHRSLSNVVANAVTVFVGLPKDLRDNLLELRALGDVGEFQDIGQKLSAILARERFEAISARVASELKVPGISSDMSDIDLMELATKITKEHLKRG